MFKSPKHSAELVVGNLLGHKSVLAIWILVIWYCFEFHALVFEFPSGKEDSSVGLFSGSSLLSPLPVVIDLLRTEPTQCP
jgi:hypothetical protein